jgi:hypothetical protein
MSNPYDDRPFPVPWTVTDEDWLVHDYFADYEAWKRWVSGKMPDICEIEFEEVDFVVMANIYACAIDACRVAAGVKDEPRTDQELDL